jgi:anion-transporting  ArsA/GET3 family ATPase
MAFAEDLKASTVRFVVGKGGVGKTTMAAALALAAAGLGRRAHLVELEGRDELARCFDRPGPLDVEPVTLFSEGAGQVTGRHLAPERALSEWMGEHGFGRLLNRLRASGALEIVATSIPGIRDVLILGKIKALARDLAGDLIIVDAPATGHSLSLLAAPSALVAAARSGPIRRQAEEVEAMLHDESRSCVSLVTIPAELAVTEAVEAAFDLEDRAGVALSTVLVNQFVGTDPMLRAPLATATRGALDGRLVAALDGARAFTLARADEEERQRARLAAELPLPQLVVPHVAADAIGLGELIEIATTMLEAP